MKNIKGFNDVYGSDIFFFDNIIKTINKIALKYNYKKVKLPTIENTETLEILLDKNINMNKNIYSFLDRNKNYITLRPEFTSSVTRFIISKNILKKTMPLKLFTYGTVFRYERPQRLRFREFNQINFEYINYNKIENFLEILLIINEIIKIFKINRKTMWEINTIGNTRYRKKYKILLKKFLLKNKDFVSEKNLKKIRNNIIKILDTKNIMDNMVLIYSPSIFNFLSVREKNNFLKLKKFFNILNIKYVHNLNLVRGLNYYYNFVFEVITSNKDLKNTVIAGGGYLISRYTGIHKIKCIGFAVGLERLSDLIYNIKNKIKNKKYICFVVNKKNIRENIKFLREIIDKIEIYFTILYIKKNILIFKDLVKMGINFAMYYNKEDFLKLKNIKSGIEKRIRKDIAIKYIYFLYKNY